MWAAVAQELRRRADSYWHDVHALRAEGEHNAVVIYRTIADELRLIADQLIEIAKRQYDEPVTTYADFCGGCGHYRGSHIYEEGACRPAGVVCACGSFQSKPDVDADMRRARAFVDDKTRNR